MRLLIINIIALVISLSSLHLSVDSGLSFNEEGTDELSSLPLLAVDPIRNPTSNRSHEIEILSPEISPLQIFAPIASIQPNDFHHYLPVYSLNRAKSYFLLI